MIRQHIIRLHIISFRWRQAKYSREKPLLPVIKALDHVIATSDLEYLMRDILRAHLQTIYCIYDEIQLFSLCFLGSAGCLCLCFLGLCMMAKTCYSFLLNQSRNAYGGCQALWSIGVVCPIY